MKLLITILFLLGSLYINIDTLVDTIALENTLETNCQQTSAWFMANQAPNKWEDHLLVSADRMNCLYAGVENPVTLAGSGVPLSQLELIANDPNVIVRPASKMGWGGSYTVVPKHGGNIVLFGRDKITGKTYDFKFRVFPMPKPIVKMGRYTGYANMTSGEVRAQPGLYSSVRLADVDMSCQITSFSLNYQVKRRDPVLLKSDSGRFKGDVKHCVRQAKPGDQYAFVNVRVRAIHRGAGVKYNGLSFKIR